MKIFIFALLQKHCHCTNPTACAIEFMKTVGVDLYIRPKVESSHESTRSAPLGFGSHKLDGVRFLLCKHVALREGMLALPYGA